MVSSGRAKFGFDHAEPEDHEYADVHPQDMDPMKALGLELKALLDDEAAVQLLLGTGTTGAGAGAGVGVGAGADDDSDLNVPQEELADARRLAGLLVTRGSIVKLRFLVDEGGLETSTPFEEKSVTAKAVEQAIFAALDAGLNEESQLFVSAGELVDQLRGEAEAHALAKLDQSDHDEEQDFPGVGVGGRDGEDQGADGRGSGSGAHTPELMPALSLNSFEAVRRYQRRNSTTKPAAEVAGLWVRVQPSIGTCYFYNVATGKTQDESPDDADEIHEA